MAAIRIDFSSDLGGEYDGEQQRRYLAAVIEHISDQHEILEKLHHGEYVGSIPLDFEFEGIDIKSAVSFDFL